MKTRTTLNFLLVYFSRFERDRQTAHAQRQEWGELLRERKEERSRF